MCEVAHFFCTLIVPQVMTPPLLLPLTVTMNLITTLRLSIPLLLLTFCCHALILFQGSFWVGLYVDLAFGCLRTALVIIGYCVELGRSRQI